MDDKNATTATTTNTRNVINEHTLSHKHTHLSKLQKRRLSLLCCYKLHRIGTVQFHLILNIFINETQKKIINKNQLPSRRFIERFVNVEL